MEQTVLKIFFLFAAAMATLYVADCCNSAICAPRVSKCMLIKCCDCDMSNKRNCSCCLDCALCLTKLYAECCSCVGLCPPPDPDDSLAKTSSVEDLPDQIPDLFNVLTEEEDQLKRWTTFTYAVDLDKLVFDSDVNFPSEMDIKIIRADRENGEQKLTKEVDARPVLGVRNCTVAFFSHCLSLSKCKASCKSMGASKYRWFHEDGCCECVGSSCYDYGLSQPHCLKCPEKTDLPFENSAVFDEDMAGMDPTIDTL